MQLELQDIGYSYNGRDRVLQHVSYSFTSGNRALRGRKDNAAFSAFPADQTHRG